MSELTITLDAEPTTRAELAAQIGTYRDVLVWIQKQVFIWLDDGGKYDSHCPLDSYLIWLFRRLTASEYRWKGRSKKDRRKFRLNRRKVLVELKTNPHRYSKTEFNKALRSGNNSNETSRFIDFNPTFIRHTTRSPAATVRQTRIGRV